MKKFTLNVDTGNHNKIPLTDQFKKIPDDTECLTILEENNSYDRYAWASATYAKLIPTSVTCIILAGNSIGLLTRQNPMITYIDQTHATVVDRFLIFLHALPDTVHTLDLSKTYLELMPEAELTKLFRGLPHKFKTLFVSYNCFKINNDDTLQGLKEALATLIHVDFLDMTGCFEKTLDEKSAKGIARSIPLSLTGIKINYCISNQMRLANTRSPIDAPWLKLKGNFKHPIYLEEQSEEKESPKHNAMGIAERAVFQQLLLTMEYAHQESLHPQYYNYFMHYMHHGKASEIEVKRAIFQVNQCLSLAEAVAIITKLLKRHKGYNLESTSGLHTNSFDTIFMQLLWADGNQPSLQHSGLLTLDKGGILELVCYPLNHMDRGEFRHGITPEALSGPKRLPVQDRAMYRERAVKGLEAILEILGLTPVVEVVERHRALA